MIRMKLKDILDGGIARDIYEAHIKQVLSEEAELLEQMEKEKDAGISKSFSSVVKTDQGSK